MRSNVLEFIKTAKANLLANKIKPALQPVFDIENSANTIFHHANYIDLTPVQFEQVLIAANELELARGHIVGAMASMLGFNGLDKSELLLSANLINSYINMLNEFARLKQARSAKPINGLQQLSVR